jgi:hypothetical protein
MVAIAHALITLTNYSYLGSQDSSSSTIGEAAIDARVLGSSSFKLTSPAIGLCNGSGYQLVSSCQFSVSIHGHHSASQRQRLPVLSIPVSQTDSPQEQRLCVMELSCRVRSRRRESLARWCHPPSRLIRSKMEGHETSQGEA